MFDKTRMFLSFLINNLQKLFLYLYTSLPVTLLLYHFLRFTGDLLLIVKSKEITQEQQDKELLEARENAIRLREETQTRESLYQDQLAASQSQQEVLNHQMEIIEERAKKLEDDLKRSSSGGTTPVMADGAVTASTAESTAQGVPEITVNYEVRD